MSCSIDVFPLSTILDNASKESFSKALGTGINGFNLKEVYITNDNEGKPCLNIEGAALELMQKRFGQCKAFVSLSHEKEYAVAFVILEKYGS